MSKGLLQRSGQGSWWPTILAVLCSAGVFLFDWWAPKGWAEAMLYVPVVLISLWSPRRGHTVLVASLSTVLTIVGFFVSAAGIPVQPAFINRLLAILVIWVTAILGLLLRRLADGLQKSETRLRTILETAPDGIITMDEQGAIESFNPAAALLFGYRPDELVGRNLSLLVAPGLAESNGRPSDAFRLQDWTTASGGRQVTGRRKDKSLFPVELSLSEMRLGRRRLFIGILHDITEREEARKRLLQSERLAAIGEAMTGLAHESRNALQRSQACLEMLASQVADRPQAVEFITDIQGAQDDLHELYEDVREYAAPVRLDRRPCLLSDVAGEAWKSLASACKGRTVKYRQSIGRPEIECDADRFALRQVFRNILENSLAACDDPVEIEIRCEPADLNGGPAVCVALWNNGPPLTAEQRTRIFDAFYTTKTHGTGLGMAIARRLVEAHGGWITVGPQSNRGAEIRITLPGSTL